MAPTCAALCGGRLPRGAPALLSHLLLTVLLLASDAVLPVHAVYAGAGYKFLPTTLYAEKPNDVDSLLPKKRGRWAYGC